MLACSQPIEKTFTINEKNLTQKQSLAFFWGYSIAKEEKAPGLKYVQKLKEMRKHQLTTDNPNHFLG